MPEINSRQDLIDELLSAAKELETKPGMPQLPAHLLPPSTPGPFPRPGDRSLIEEVADAIQQASEKGLIPPWPDPWPDLWSGPWFAHSDVVGIINAVAFFVAQAGGHPEPPPTGDRDRFVWSLETIAKRMWKNDSRRMRQALKRAKAPSPTLGVREAAKRMDPQPAHVRRLCHDGKLTATQDKHGEYHIEPSVVDDYRRLHPSRRKPTKTPEKPALTPPTALRTWLCPGFGCEEEVQSAKRPNYACKCGRIAWTCKNRPPPPHQ